jgi:large subunit ribosomal protein L15
MDISKVVGVDVGRRRKRRKGRGTASGAGKTSGRGSKGAAARSGFGGLMHREGGQMPLIRRIPKRGFTNIFRVEFEVLNVRELVQFAGESITPDLLKSHGLLKKRAQRLKILGDGELEAALDIHAHAFSKTAREKIEAAGGTVTVLAEGDGGSSDDAAAADADGGETAE